MVQLITHLFYPYPLFTSRLDFLTMFNDIIVAVKNIILKKMRNLFSYDALDWLNDVIYLYPSSNKNTIASTFFYFPLGLFNSASKSYNGQIFKTRIDCITSLQDKFRQLSKNSQSTHSLFKDVSDMLRPNFFHIFGFNFFHKKTAKVIRFLDYYCNTATSYYYPMDEDDESEIFRRKFISFLRIVKHIDFTVNAVSIIEVKTNHIKNIEEINRIANLIDIEYSNWIEADIFPNYKLLVNELTSFISSFKENNPNKS